MMNARRFHFSSLLLILLLVAPPGSLSATSIQQSPPEYFPTDGWRTSTPEEQGVDSEKLAAALDFSRQRGMNIHSLLIVRNGFVVLESYFYPYEGKDVHDVASVTKGVTSTLVGVAMGDSKSARQPVLELFSGAPVANVEARKRQLTIEHLLTMTSGLECTPKENELTLLQMKQSSDWVRYMLNLPMAEEPGSKFVYCSGGMHLLSGIISRAAGVSALDFARQRLFKPLGIHDAIWPSDPQGVSHGWGDLHLHPRDMAKIGYLWLNHGAWDGRQIVSADWIKESSRAHVPTGAGSDYGYGLWVRPSAGLFEALGRGGQRISVVPSKNLVVVFTGGGFDPGEVGTFIADAVKSDRPLPENRAGVARLAAAVAAAALPPAAKSVPPPSKTAAKVAGKTFVFEENPLGLKSISLTFPTQSEAAASFTFSDRRFTEEPTKSRPVGLDGVARMSSGGRFGLPVGLKGFWENEQTFVIDYDEIANINAYQFKLKFSDKEVSIQLTERTGTAKLSFNGKER